MVSRVGPFFMGKMVNKLSYDQKNRLIEVKLTKGLLIFTWDEYTRGIERGKRALRQRQWEKYAKGKQDPGDMHRGSDGRDL